MKKQHIPTFITFIRLLSIPFFILLWFYMDREILYNRFLLAFLFSLMSFTDFLDGYIARKYNIETDVGKFLDPIADKILVYSTFLLFLNDGIIDIFSLLILLSREFIVDACRLVALRCEKKIISANIFAKYKTFFQFLSIILFLIFYHTEVTYLNIFMYSIYYISVFLAVFSSIIYFKNVCKYFKTGSIK